RRLIKAFATHVARTKFVAACSSDGLERCTFLLILSDCLRRNDRHDGKYDPQKRGARGAHQLSSSNTQAGPDRGIQPMVSIAIFVSPNKRLAHGSRRTIALARLRRQVVYPQRPIRGSPGPRPGLDLPPCA